MEQDDNFKLYSEKFNMEAEHVGKYPISIIFAHFREKVIKKTIDILLLEERKHSF